MEMMAMGDSLAKTDGADFSLIETVVVQGDLAALSSEDRTAYYMKVCKSVGLNPLTQPFQYLRLNGKLLLYAARNCTDQLRKIHDVSVGIVDRSEQKGIYVVTARATTPSGRSDESTGAVCLGNLRGENLANALMKAETKAKRRVTLSICGLSWMDDTEVDSVPAATRVDPGEPSRLPSNATPPKPELPESGVVRFGPHAGAPLAKPKAEWLVSYLSKLHAEAETETPPDFALLGHIAEVEGELEARAAEEAFDAAEKASGESDRDDVASAEEVDAACTQVANESKARLLGDMKP